MKVSIQISSRFVSLSLVIVLFPPSFLALVRFARVPTHFFSCFSLAFLLPSFPLRPLCLCFGFLLGLSLFPPFLIFFNLLSLFFSLLPPFFQLLVSPLFLSRLYWLLSSLPVLFSGFIFPLLFGFVQAAFVRFYLPSLVSHSRFCPCFASLLLCLFFFVFDSSSSCASALFFSYRCFSLSLRSSIQSDTCISYRLYPII